MPEFAEFFSALSSRNWPLVVAFGLTFVVYVIRSVTKDKAVPVKYVPYLTLGLAVFGAVAARIIEFVSSNHTWWHGLIQGVVEGAIVGLSAMGWWSVGVKKVLPESSKE